MLHKTKSSGSTMYGRCKVAVEGRTVVVNFQDKDKDKSSKGKDVWNDVITYRMNKAKFMEYVPETVTTINPKVYFFFAAPKPEGKELEVIYQFRPWTMEEEAVIKFKGFARDDKKNIRQQTAYKNNKQHQCTIEFEVVRGPWTGTIYPYRYFNLQDKFGNAIFEVIDHELHMGWMGAGMENILTQTGFDGSPLADICKLADTDDPEAILSWMEKVIRKIDTEMAVEISGGYPDISTLHVFDGEDVDDDFDADKDDKDEQEEDEDVEESPAKPTKKSIPVAKKRMDEDNEE